jgi:hypothetical protein
VRRSTFSNSGWSRSVEPNCVQRPEEETVEVVSGVSRVAPDAQGTTGRPPDDASSEPAERELGLEWVTVSGAAQRFVRTP